MSKYFIKDNYKILKTTKLYSDGKTQVPKKVIEILQLKHGSQIVWAQFEQKILIMSPVTLCG